MKNPLREIPFDPEHVYHAKNDSYPLEHGWLWKWFKSESFNTAKSRRRAPARMAAEFETVTNLGVRGITLGDGRVFQRVQIFGCYNLK